MSRQTQIKMDNSRARGKEIITPVEDPGCVQNVEEFNHQKGGSGSIINVGEFNNQ